MAGDEYIKRKDVIDFLHLLGSHPVVMFDGDGTCRRCVDQLADAVKKLPAADVVEVKRGKWIEEEDGYDHVYYSCSVCNAGICTIDETPIEYGWKYCPECGSKMEELVRLTEEDEEEQI